MVTKLGVVVVAGDRQQSQECCGLLGSLDYATTILHSLEDLEGCLQESLNLAVILDLDTVQVGKQFFRTLKKKHPGVHILGVSSKAYHPGLEEVIGSHLYACLVKPLDIEELSYWLKTIAENLAEPEAIAEP